MIRSVALAVLLTACACASALAATPVGDWKTPEHNGVVRISQCDGDALCGKLVDGDDLRADPDVRDTRNQDPAKRARLMKGLTLFDGVKGGPTEWTGGSLYNPEDGKTYHGSIKLVDANTLKLTGCVFAPFCRSQTWTRLK
jgi:uncharacterized protein (DUF2147 family)